MWCARRGEGAWEPAGNGARVHRAAAAAQWRGRRGRGNVATNLRSLDWASDVFHPLRLIGAFALDALALSLGDHRGEREGSGGKKEFQVLATLFCLVMDGAGPSDVVLIVSDGVAWTEERGGDGGAGAGGRGDGGVGIGLRRRDAVQSSTVVRKAIALDYVAKAAAAGGAASDVPTQVVNADGTVCIGVRAGRASKRREVETEPVADGDSLEDALAEALPRGAFLVFSTPHATSHGVRQVIFAVLLLADLVLLSLLFAALHQSQTAATPYAEKLTDVAYFVTTVFVHFFGAVGVQQAKLRFIIVYLIALLCSFFTSVLRFSSVLQLVRIGLLLCLCATVNNLRTQLTCSWFSSTTTALRDSGERAAT